MDSRISTILEHWFISEPALFSVLCAHEIVENTDIACPLRCGRRRVEYNPDFIREMSGVALDEALRTEAIRLLLKHPYERRPDLCCNEAIALGSNVCIGDNYRYGSFSIDRPSDYSLEGGRPYEWYARRIQEMLPPGEAPGEGGGADRRENASQPKGSGQEGQGGKGVSPERSRRNRDLSELWEEDELALAMINGIIESTRNWGSLGGSLVEMLKASTKARINWKHVFSGFRASILSSRRQLTRMRPNRRSGFDQMGSVRRFDTRLLVAVDVSGSISSDALSYFYGVINSAFRYGFEAVDVIQFDCGITQVQSLKKKMKDVVEVGRGGTSFQEPIDYAEENGYDGLVILTDGYAPAPAVRDGMRCKIIWVCRDKDCYESHHQWMEKSGRVCTMELT